jgi:hypothetical protein
LLLHQGVPEDDEVDKVQCLGEVAERLLRSGESKSAQSRDSLIALRSVAEDPGPLGPRTRAGHVDVRLIRDDTSPQKRGRMVRGIAPVAGHQKRSPGSDLVCHLDLVAHVDAPEDEAVPAP